MKQKISKNDARKIMESIGDGHPLTQYRRGQHVFRQNDPSDAVFYIQSGKIQIMAVSDQGKEGIVSIMEPYDFFGEGCLAGQPLHTAHAIALADSTIMRIEKDVMLQKLQDNSAFSRLFMVFLLSRSIQIEKDLVKQLFNSSEMRLARVLLQLANFEKDEKMEGIIPLANLEILAARVGTTVSRIDFFLDRFQRLGFIELNGGMKVHASLLNVIVNE
jgi:CRP/FNR family transcriptional regulator, cyclic AMP receptor protein